MEMSRWFIGGWEENMDITAVYVIPMVVFDGSLAHVYIDTTHIFHHRQHRVDANVISPFTRR